MLAHMLSSIISFTASTEIMHDWFSFSFFFFFFGQKNILLVGHAFWNLKIKIVFNSTLRSTIFIKTKVGKLGIFTRYFYFTKNNFLFSQFSLWNLVQIPRSPKMAFGRPSYHSEKIGVYHIKSLWGSSFRFRTYR